MAKHSDRVAFCAGEVLERTAKQYPRKTALIAREEKLTFAELNEKVACLAGHLRHEGVRQRDRVGILLPNSVAFALCYYATQKVGAVTVVLDARLRGKELAGVLQDADLVLLITHGRLMPEVSDALRTFGQIPLWVVGGEAERGFEKRLSAAPVDFVRPALAPEDDALILYTSGTTGDPKGVVLNRINLAQFPPCTAQVWKTSPDSIWGCILPMSHISGPILCNELVDKGSTLVVIDQFNPMTLLESIEKHRITVFHGVPTLFQLMLGVPSLKDYDTKSLRVVGMMGASVPPPLLRGFKQAQPHVKVVQGYGLTETSPLITAVPLEDADAKMESIGRAVPGVEVKIVNDAGEEVPVGEAGEIITRGPHVMKGYFRRPEATAERIRDGWLYTGDIGRMESDGFYHHLGRKDDMIITGGLNVYPAEIENLLYEKPQVQEAVVFPILDEKRGTVIGAAVALRPGETLGERELLSFLRANLATFKVPQKLKILDSLPRTTSGKVIRDPSVLLAD